MRLISLIITDFGSNAKYPLAAVCLACWLMLAGCQAFTTTPEPNLVQVIIPAPKVAVGQPRLPLILYDGANVVSNAQAMKLELMGLKNGIESPTPESWQGTATAYMDAPTPYWVAYPALPQAGLWGLRATITLADGRLTTADFVVEATDTPEGIAIGQPAASTRQQVFADQSDLRKLTSDPEPDPALYQMTIAEALQTGKPTVLTFATPAFCQTRFCAPVIQVVKTARQRYTDTANFIHIEVWADFATQRLNPALAEWHLSSEPWTYVLDRKGYVVAALAGPISLAELQSWLDTSLQP